MMRVLSGLLVAAGLLATTASASAQGVAKRGEYLVAIMDCTGCHTPGTFIGKPDMERFLGGSEVGFQIPGLGIFYPPNLTPHAETGLGKWSTDDIIKAVRTGVRPDGRQLAPVMPWHSYSKLTDADAQALASFLKSLKPVEHRVPAITGPTEKATAPYLAVVTPP